MTISQAMATTIQTIRDDFSLLDEWEDRYRYVIELGEALPPFPDADSGVGDSGWRSLSLPLQTGVAVRGPEY